MYDNGCLDAIKVAWEKPRNNGTLKVVQKINACREQPQHWSHTQFGSIRRELKKIKQSNYVTQSITL